MEGTAFLTTDDRQPTTDLCPITRNLPPALFPGINDLDKNSRQNILNKGVIGKIFISKDLAGQFCLSSRHPLADRELSQCSGKARLGSPVLLRWAETSGHRSPKTLLLQVILRRRVGGGKAVSSRSCVMPQDTRACEKRAVPCRDSILIYHSTQDSACDSVLGYDLFRPCGTTLVRLHLTATHQAEFRPKLVNPNRRERTPELRNRCPATNRPGTARSRAVRVYVRLWLSRREMLLEEVHRHGVGLARLGHVGIVEEAVEEPVP